MASTTTTTTTATHILVFPFPAQGHILALLDLTHQLALCGLNITILVTPKNLPMLNPLLSTHPNSIQTLILPFPSHPRLPQGVEHVKDIGNSGNIPIIAALSKLEGEVLKWFENHPSPPQAILSDFFLGFTHSWAEKLKIPRISFSSAGAFLTCLLHQLLQDMDKFSGLKIVKFSNLPGSPSFSYENLPSIFRKCREGDSDSEIVKESLLANYKSWGIVFNSFYALEHAYLDHIEESGTRVFAVGPVSPIGRYNPDLDARSGVLNWLDKCPHGSVLYVCFGSQKLLTRPQIEALALSLEKSETRFLWVMNAATGKQIPDGFEERVTDRGLVVMGWAPQVEILNHGAVGGFLSHCGWNSTLESIMAGMMILAWPMEADQHVNARLLVEDMGIAVRFCEGEHTVPGPPDVLAEKISELINGNRPQKERAMAMKEKAAEAVKVGGSSFKDMDTLVNELRKFGAGQIIDKEFHQHHYS